MVDVYVYGKMLEVRRLSRIHKYAALGELNLAEGYATSEGIELPSEFYALKHIICRGIVYEKLQLAREDAKDEDWLSAASSLDAVEIYADIETLAYLTKIEN